MPEKVGTAVVYAELILESAPLGFCHHISSEYPTSDSVIQITQEYPI
jgi:hypothetical protein